MNNFDDLDKTQEELIKRKEELLNDFNNRKKSCLMGCFMPIIVIIVLFIISSIYVMRLPAFKPMVKCIQNQVEIYEAIHRYKDLNNKYPHSLKDIAKDYLKDPNNIYCPLDKEKKGYIYTPNSDIVISCHRHKLQENQPKIIISIDKKGQFKETIENK